MKKKAAIVMVAVLFILMGIVTIVTVHGFGGYKLKLGQTRRDLVY